jgi:hypothetical protein
MIIERAYRNGLLSGYRWDDKTIPLAPGNRDFDLITEAIAQGQCEVREPHFGVVYRTFDQHGAPSGYRGSFGFLPSYRESELLALLHRQIDDGRASLDDNAQTPPPAPGPRYEKLVFSISLDHPWPISSACVGDFNYRSRENSAPTPYRFTLVNLQRSESKVDLIRRHHNLTPNSNFNVSENFGILEVEVPVKGLRTLYQGERNLIPEDHRSFLSTLEEEHLAETRRSRPDIGWLINMAYLYASHFILEISNAISDVVKLEYGSSPLQHLYEGYGQVRPDLFGCTSAGEYHHIVPGDYRKMQNTFPPEPLLYALARHEADAQSPGYLRRVALRRVAEMAKLGFHLEALAPLNAFLEIAFMQTLQACVSDSPQVLPLVQRLGHAERLEIFSEISKFGAGSYPCDEAFKEMIATCKAIYRHRNQYVHDLLVHGISGRPTLLDTRRLEAYFHGFLDLHEQQQFLMRLNSVATDNGALRQFLKESLQLRVLAGGSESNLYLPPY